MRREEPRASRDLYSTVGTISFYRSQRLRLLVAVLFIADYLLTSVSTYKSIQYWYPHQHLIGSSTSLFFVKPDLLCFHHCSWLLCLMHHQILSDRKIMQVMIKVLWQHPFIHVMEHKQVVLESCGNCMGKSIFWLFWLRRETKVASNWLAPSFFHIFVFRRETKVANTRFAPSFFRWDPPPVSPPSSFREWGHQFERQFFLLLIFSAKHHTPRPQPQSQRWPKGSSAHHHLVEYNIVVVKKLKIKSLIQIWPYSEQSTENLIDGML